MNSLKSSLLGCGRMGRRHAQVLNEMGFVLLSIADPVEACRDLVANNSESRIKPSLHKDLNDLLVGRIPDLLVIATTADVHVENAIKAINAGISLILLEKPIGTSLFDCQRLQKASQENETRIAVNHQMRFLPQYTIPKALANSEAYGGFQSMHVAAGNFGMAMNGTHYLEAFRFIANEAPSEVSAWFDSEKLPNPRGAQFHDVSGCMRVITKSGKRLYIDTSADQGQGVQVTYMARNGRITVDELTGAMKTVVRRNEHREAPTSRYGMPVDIQQQQIPPIDLVESTKAVLQALLNDDNYPNLADATLAVKTLVAAYHSHRKCGKSIKLVDIDEADKEVFSWA